MASPEKTVFGFRSRKAIIVSLLALIIVIFFAGFALGRLGRMRSVPAAASPPPTDFAIAIPEGKSTITISDPRLDPNELARLVVERHGNSINGIPELPQTIGPRNRLSREDVEFFRRELAGVIQPSDSSWQRANRIRDWLSSGRYQKALPGLATRVPREAYTEMRQGKPVLCGNLAEIYVALCESAGLIARTVGLSLMVRDGTFGSDTHAGAEVWLPDLGGWVYEDPTFNCYWEVDGRPASAIHLHNALMDGCELKSVSASPQAEALIRNYYVDPRLLFRHISYEYKPGGPLLYYVDGRLEPLNMRDHYWIQISEPAVFESLDSNGNNVVEKRGEVATGIFVQLIGDKLFIRDRRDENRGIRVRSSSGAVEACAYEHWRAEELGVFRGRNLVVNGSFNTTGESGVADNWSVNGPIEALTTMGGQGLGTQAGGKLWQRIPVQPGRQYLMYAKLSVARGTVAWSLADTSRGMQSKGLLKPSQMSEVLSDLVESHSGYLDVSFESPEGGGFRVMDVIVTELSADPSSRQSLVSQVSRHP